MDTTTSTNLLEFAESAFKEEIDTDLDGNTIKRLSCSLCDFKNQNVGGMKRHIHASHKPPAGVKKHGLDESVHGRNDEKKAKVDEFEPSFASTQRKTRPNNLDVTVSGMSNDTLANLFEDNFIFHNDNNIVQEPGQDDDDLDENLIDLEDAAALDEGDDPVIDTITNNADVALMNIRMRKLEEELKIKDLKMAEKESQSNLLQIEVGTMSEEIGKLKTDAKKKEEALENSLANSNKMEEELKIKTRRIEIMQPVVNKKLSELKMRRTSNGNDTEEANDEVSKFKKDIKAKDSIISKLKKDKSELANELRDLQEKTEGKDFKDMIDKCIKLTSELGTKQTENKNKDKEIKKLNENVSNLQASLNVINGKLAESEVNRTRLHDFNNQLMEFQRGSRNLDELDKNHKNDVASQNIVFKDTTKATNKEAPKVDKKCWHYEQGWCKKGTSCNYLHPIQICEPYKRFGECPQGLMCPLRHPLNICMDYMENKCSYGDFCVLQHPSPPSQPMSSLSSAPSQPIYSTPITTYSNPQPAFSNLHQGFLANPSLTTPPPLSYPLLQPRYPATQFVPVTQPQAQMPGYQRGGPRGGPRGPRAPRTLRPQAPQFAGARPQISGQEMMYGAQTSPSQGTQQQGFW